MKWPYLSAGQYGSLCYQYILRIQTQKQCMAHTVWVSALERMKSAPNISFFLSCVEGSHSFIISRHNSLLT